MTKISSLELPIPDITDQEILALFQSYILKEFLPPNPSCTVICSGRKGLFYRTLCLNCKISQGMRSYGGQNKNPLNSLSFLKRFLSI